MELEIHSLGELESVAEKLLQYAGSERLFTFQGEIGAGKTTLIQAICRHLGVEEEVTSPTFALVNEYAGTPGRIYHLDLYRLKTEQEALDMGIEEYLDSGEYCFIEWPEVIADLLPADFIAVKIELSPESSRKIIFL